LAGSSLISLVLLVTTNILWDEIKPWLYEELPTVCSEVIHWMVAHPVGAIAIIALLILIVLMTQAYIDTRPPRGLMVTEYPYDDKDRIYLRIDNHTGFDLHNCYLQLNWVKGDIAPKQYIVERLPAEVPSFVIGEGPEVERIIIENKKNAIYEIAGYAELKQTCFLNAVKDIGFINAILFDGLIKAEYQFGGTKPTYEVPVKTFEVTIQNSNGELELKRIRK